MLSCWKQYNNLPLLEYNDGTPIHLETFPCKEIMMAYALGQTLQRQWALSLSPEALFGVMQLDEELDELDSEQASEIKSIIIQTHEKELGEFLPVWQEIKNLLLRQHPEQQEYINFSGHGLIISFSPNLMTAQSANVVHKDRLVNLGCTMLDSSYAESLDPFYRISAAEQKLFHDSATTIQKHVRAHHAGKLFKGHKLAAKEEKKAANITEGDDRPLNAKK
jgi:hypothetical protein